MRNCRHRLGAGQRRPLCAEPGSNSAGANAVRSSCALPATRTRRGLHFVLQFLAVLGRQMNNDVGGNDHGGRPRQPHQARVREQAQGTHNARLVPADLTVSRTSPLCGSTLAFRYAMTDEPSPRWDIGPAPASLGMASRRSSLPRRRASFAEIGEVCDISRPAGGENVVFPITGKSSACSMAASAFLTRHGSIMLPFDALAEAAGKLG